MRLGDLVEKALVLGRDSGPVVCERRGRDARLVAQERPYALAPALGRHLHVVAPLERQHQAAAARHPRQAARHVPEHGGRQLEPAQGVAVGRVEARAHEHEVRLEGPQHRQHHPLEGNSEGGVADRGVASLERDIEVKACPSTKAPPAHTSAHTPSLHQTRWTCVSQSEARQRAGAGGVPAFTLALPDAVHRAGAGVEVRLVEAATVHRYVQYSWVVVKYLFDSVAMVNIPIENGDFLCAPMLLGISGCCFVISITQPAARLDACTEPGTKYELPSTRAEPFMTLSMYFLS
mmetsp:Transcript_70852/g.189173  ORF Transcript_70852/g.189173 Transcript_70852/m.189173 type:complete len:291 (+) Transcript_70852:94-966(+)